MPFERALVRFLNSQSSRRPSPLDGYSIGAARTITGDRPAAVTFAGDPPQHSLICGRTGTGKTTFLLRLMAEHLRAGVPFLFIDFHGPATDHILAVAGSEPQASSLVLVEPWSDPVVGFNPLDSGGESPYPVVQELVAVFHHRLWPDAWGPRLEELLRMTLLALAQTNLTLIEAPRFLATPEFRRAVLSRVSLAEVRDFWALRFERLSPSQKALVTETVLNKLSVFQDPVLRYFVGQQPASLNLDHALSQRQTVIVNLSAGRLWGSNLLLAALLVAKLKGAVYRRPPHAAAYSIFLDEFQEMVSLDVLDDYLRSFRKFGCSVYLATQHLTMPPQIRAAIFGNCQRFISFAMSAHDAGVLGTEFGGPDGHLAGHLLPDLPTGDAMLKIRGKPTVRLRVEPATARVTAEKIAIGRNRSLRDGQHRETIDADCRRRVSGPRPAALSQVRIRSQAAATVAECLPEGYGEP